MENASESNQMPQIVFNYSIEEHDGMVYEYFIDYLGNVYYTNNREYHCHYKDFFEKYNGKYPIFKATSCAVSYTLNIADYNAIKNSFLCNKNKCPIEQKNRCEKQYSKLSEVDIKKLLNKIGVNMGFQIQANKIIIKQKLTTSQKVFLKMSTALDVVSDEGDDYYWNTSNNTKDILILEEKKVE